MFSGLSDALVAMEKAMKRDNIVVNDRQLACARITSQEGQDYLKGMAAAGNYAWVNRSSMTFLTRQVVFITPSGGGGVDGTCSQDDLCSCALPLRRSLRSSARRPTTWTCTSSTTCPTTSPRWRSTWWTGGRGRCSSTAKVPPGRSLLTTRLIPVDYQVGSAPRLHAAAAHRAAADSLLV